MSKNIASFAGIGGAKFDHLSGTDDAAGFAGLTKLVTGADGAAPTLVDKTNPLPAATPNQAQVATNINMATLGATQTFASEGRGTVIVSVAAIAGGGVLTPKRLMPDGSWLAITAKPLVVGGKSVGTITAAGNYEFYGGGGDVELEVTTAGTGTTAVAWRATWSPNQISIRQSAPADALVGACSIVGAPQVTTGAAATYAVGSSIGGILSFAVPDAIGNLVAANVVLGSGTFTGALDLILFSASPTGGGVVDQAAFALTSTDWAKVIGVIHLTDVSSLGGVVTAVAVQNIGQAFAAAGATLYAALVVRGAAVTLTAANHAVATIEVAR